MLKLLSLGLLSALLFGCSGDETADAVPCSGFSASNVDCPSGQVCDFVSDVCVPDCEQPGAGCVGAAVCEPDDNDVLACAATAAATCTGEGPQAVSFQTTEGASASPTVHWAAGEGCIATSYEGDAKALAEQFRAAVAAFNAIPCNQLCLESPVQSEELPSLYRGERRIHLLGRLPEDTTLTSEMIAEVNFYPENGQIRGGMIWAGETALASAKVSDFLYSIGTTVGLAHTLTPGSMMVPVFARDTPTEPSEEDVIAICTLYGEPPYCTD